MQKHWNKNMELYKLRTVRGLDAKGVAKIAGVSYGVIVRLENDHSIPRSKNIPALARAYGVSVEEFIEIILRAKTGVQQPAVGQGGR